MTSGYADQPIDDPGADRLPGRFWGGMLVVAVSAGVLGFGVAMGRWWVLFLLVVIVVGTRAMWRAHRAWVQGLDAPEDFDDGDE